MRNNYALDDIEPCFTRGKHRAQRGNLSLVNIFNERMFDESRWKTNAKEYQNSRDEFRRREEISKRGIIYVCASSEKVVTPFSGLFIGVLRLKMHRSCLNSHVLFAGHVTNIGGRKSWRAVRGNGGKKGTVPMNFSRVSERTRRKTSITRVAIIVFHSFSRSATVLLGYSSPYLIVQSLSRLVSSRRWFQIWTFFIKNKIFSVLSKSRERCHKVVERYVRFCESTQLHLPIVVDRLTRNSRSLCRTLELDRKVATESTLTKVFFQVYYICLYRGKYLRNNIGIGGVGASNVFDLFNLIRAEEHRCSIQPEDREGKTARFQTPTARGFSYR